MQWVWENLSLFQNKEVFWKQLGGCCHLSFLSISKLTNSNFVLLDIWKVQLINAYMFIDFSSSFCPLGASKLKEKKKVKERFSTGQPLEWKFFVHRQNCCAAPSPFSPAPVSLGLLRVSRSLSLSLRGFGEVPSKYLTGNLLLTPEHHRNSVYNCFKVHILLCFF